MFAASPSQFQALQSDWQLTNEALSKAEAGVVEALKLYRSSGDECLLRPALSARRLASERMRTLMQAIWSNPI